MTELSTHIATDRCTGAALARLGESIGRHGADASLAFVFFGAGHDAAAIRAWAAQSLPGVPFIGGTSCRGVLANGHHPDPSDIGLLLVHDAEGDFGTGAAGLGDAPEAAAVRALSDALAAAGCSGELPAALWVFQTPGQEERVIAGLRSVVGDRCAILGGSAADDTVSGDWAVISNAAVEGPSVAVAALFPGRPLGLTFQSGYAPSGRTGVVTAAQGRRIDAIDGRPAADVYDEWTGHAATDRLARVGNVLAAASLTPLGVPLRKVAGIVQHRLIHPAAISETRAIEAFAEVEVGAVVELMTGSADRLARRAGRALRDATGELPADAPFAGALLVYCGGCMMAIGDALSELVEGVGRAALGRPVLGIFTFGEQGPIGQTCVHANLTVSAMVFSE